MLAYREWRVFLHQEDLRPILVSTYMNTVWIEAELLADMEPESPPYASGLGTLHGVHAATADYPRGQHAAQYLHTIGLRRTCHGQPFARGVVDLFGKIVEHEDGVLRASGARVLALQLLMPRVTCGDNCDAWIGCEYGFVVTDGLHGPPPHAPLAHLRQRCPIGCHVASDEEFWESVEPAVMPVRASWQKLCRGGRRPSYTTAELERLLLERYEVPRMPDGEGPWFRDVHGG